MTLSKLQEKFNLAHTEFVVAMTVHTLSKLKTTQRDAILTQTRR
jgi:hypothetical protein